MAIDDVVKCGHNILAMPKRRTTSSTVGAAEFKSRCLELVSHVREARVEYVVTKHGTPVAKLVPIDDAPRASVLGSMKGTVLEYVRPFDPVPAAWSIDTDEDA